MAEDICFLCLKPSTLKVLAAFVTLSKADLWSDKILLMYK